MSDDTPPPVELLRYDRREELYRQLVDVTHLLGQKVLAGLRNVRKYPPAGLTRAFKAYASTALELNRDMLALGGKADASRKPVYALSEEEFATELAGLARHVVRSMPRAEVDALLAEPVYAATSHQEQGDDDEQEPDEA